MYTKSTSKSALFLMELILAIFFFALASAVCIQLFVKAHMLGASSTNKNHSVMWAENIAETFLGTDGDFSETVAALNATPVGDQTFCLYFDSEWDLTDSENAVFIAAVTTSYQNHRNDAQILLTDTEHNIIYQLDVTKHEPYQS